MTFEINTFIRAHILEMPAYQPIYPLDVIVEELGLSEDKLIKLDANENPFGALPEVLAALASLQDSHIYPDPESRRVRALLAKYHQVSEQSIVLGAGADELIDLIMRLVIDPGDKIINCPPTFGMYSFDASLNQAKVIDVPRCSDFSLDVEGIQYAIQEYQPKLIFLANPNNPDGKLVPPEIIKVLLTYPLLVVLDEAYFNFSEAEDDWIQKVPEYGNLIVLRTFSKWAGLAGLRIGYGVFPENFVPVMMKAKQPYNISVAAQEAARVSLLNIEQLVQNTTHIILERQRLFEKLLEIPWLIPRPSSANFILCKVTRKNALHVKQRLREKGILIRHFNKPGLDDHIRISVGKPEHTDRIIDILKIME
ncbi:MAG: histidinol-phosphate transaminase [Chloroflexi bacterium]|nr:histidinol-phosphate transaminase [Chloroflexota bacterium]